MKILSVIFSICGLGLMIYWRNDLTGNLSHFVDIMLILIWAKLFYLDGETDELREEIRKLGK